MTNRHLYKDFRFLDRTVQKTIVKVTVNMKVDLMGEPAKACFLDQTFKIYNMELKLGV